MARLSRSAGTCRIARESAVAVVTLGSQDCTWSLQTSNRIRAYSVCVKSSTLHTIYRYAAISVLLAGGIDGIGALPMISWW